ncbi:MAG: hypothetical protein WBG14_18945, partial [Rhodococcus sp. (in: high G+C Gram-positive bacteria)]
MATSKGGHGYCYAKVWAPRSATTMILLWTSSRACRVTLHTAGGFAACARKYVSHYVFPRTCGEAAYIC